MLVNWMPFWKNFCSSFLKTSYFEIKKLNNFIEYINAGFPLVFNPSPVNDSRIISQKMSSDPVRGNTSYRSEKQQACQQKQRLSEQRLDVAGESARCKFNRCEPYKR